MRGITKLMRGDTETPVKAKFLTTCRLERDIQEFDIGGHLRISSEEVNADLSKFIQVRVDDLSKKKKYPTGLKELIEETLQKKAGGTFLWVSLVLKSLEAVATSQVECGLQTLPSDLNRVYDSILSQIDARNVEPAKSVLRLVAMARRPLTVRELTMARALGPGGWTANTIPPVSHLDQLEDGYTYCEPLVYVHPKDET